MKVIKLEVYNWAICPECGHQFLLTEENNPITDRYGLPPNIRSHVTALESLENPAQWPLLCPHQDVGHTQNCIQDIQPSDHSQRESKVNESDDHSHDKEGQLEDDREL